MQPTLVSGPIRHEGWVCEEKYDGGHMLAYKDGDRVQLISRPGRDHTRRFPQLVAAVAALRPSTIILDGEVCIFDRQLVSRIRVAPAWQAGRRGDPADVHGLRLPPCGRLSELGAPQVSINVVAGNAGNSGGANCAQAIVLGRDGKETEWLLAHELGHHITGHCGQGLASEEAANAGAIKVLQAWGTSEGYAVRKTEQHLLGLLRYRGNRRSRATTTAPSTGRCGVATRRTHRTIRRATR